MPRSVRSTSTAGAARRGVAALCLTFFAATAAMAEEPSFKPTDRFLELIRQPFEGPLFQPNRDWREKGLAFIDLPFRIRARFDANYSHFRTRPDRLAAPQVDQAGPGLRFDRHIESRVALTLPLREGVEFGVVWETRNRIEAGDPLAFGRQVVGAMIRITPGAGPAHGAPPFQRSKHTQF